MNIKARFDTLFKPYRIPKKIKNISVKICTRFLLSGVCDPMYIANLIGVENKIGDGKGHFISDYISNPELLAMVIQTAYSDNILSNDIPELVEIIKTGTFDNKKASKAIENKIIILTNKKAVCPQHEVLNFQYQIDFAKNVLEIIKD